MPDAGITGCSAITAWSFVGKDPLNENAAIQMAKVCAENNRAADPAVFGIENHARQIVRIAEAIETGMPVDVTGREARKSVSIIEAIYRSSAAKTQFFPD